VKKTTKQNRPLVPRQKVLIVAQGNGLVEVYAGDNIDVHFVNRLFVGDETAEEANLIDAYHEGTMPRPYRELFIPGQCRALGFHEKVTPEMADDALYQKRILQGLREFREENKPAPVAIARARRDAR
jgi:hypothetical protein